MKTGEQIADLAIANKLHEEAKQRVIAKFNVEGRAGRIREAEMRVAYVDAVVEIAASEGISHKLKIDHTQTSLASGWNTSTLNYQPDGMGRWIFAGDAVNLASVIEVGGQRAINANNFVVKGKRKALELVEIDYTKSEGDFSRNIEGLTKRQMAAHLANYRAVQAVLREIVRSNLTYEALIQSVYAELTDKWRTEKPVAKMVRRFGNRREIHKNFRKDRRQVVPLIRFDNEKNATGHVCIGDVITIEPIASIPGSEGFKGAIQIRITEDGFRFAKDG